MSLTDRVALITGGARMGASLASALASCGADVALSYATSGDAAWATVASVQAQGRRAAAFPADLSTPSSCQGLIDDVLAWAGRLDVLVCLASRYERVSLGDLTPAAWRSALAVDLDGSFHCARSAAAHMRTRRSGHIILCSDWVAASGRPRYSGYVPYYVAKAGVVALTEALALELAPDDVQVNAVAPGPILPAAGTTPAMQDAVMKATPLGHWGSPDVITHAILGLLEQEWVTGQTIRVDGGRHLL